MHTNYKNQWMLKKTKFIPCTPKCQGAILTLLKSHKSHILNHNKLPKRINNKQLENHFLNISSTCLSTRKTPTVTTFQNSHVDDGVTLRGCKIDARIKGAEISMAASKTSMKCNDYDKLYMVKVIKYLFAYSIN